MKAEDYLLQVNKLVKLIRNKKAEREMWYDLATSTTKPLSPDKVQSSGNPQKMADAVCERAGLEVIIQNTLEELEGKLLEIVTTLESLPAVQYDVLHLIYIQGKTPDDVAEIYSRSKRWANNKRMDALRRLQRILDSREKGE